MLPTPVPPVSPPTIVRAFSPATHDWLPAHRGVDLSARVGQAVFAPRTGTVAVVRIIANRPVVVLRSGDVRFTFEPVVGRVAVGERVRMGEPIGVLGTGGHCDGRCLHWGAKIAGDYVDPLSFLPRRGPVLKPLVTARSSASAAEGRAVICCESG